jgi:hypothetical protein
VINISGAVGGGIKLLYSVKSTNARIIANIKYLSITINENGTFLILDTFFITFTTANNPTIINSSSIGPIKETYVKIFSIVLEFIFRFA